MFRRWPKRDPNKHYYLVPNEVFNLGLSSHEIAVYNYLLRCEDRRTYQCHPSYRTIGKAVQLSENTVRKYVAGLEEKGLIRTEPSTITTKDGRMRNGSLIYTIRPIQEAMLGHVSAATTLDIYTHITDDMRLTAAANIDCGIGKATPQEDASEPGQEIAQAQAEKPKMTDFKPYVGRKRKSGTGCVSQINDHLFEGRYSPKWPDGKKHARNVYAHTREECEEKLKVLIIDMKTELAELKRQKAEGALSPQEPEKGKKKSEQKAKKPKKKSK